MPWKEPGEKPREPRQRKPRERDPWGPGGGSGGGGPDLEAWLRKMRRRLGPFGRGPNLLLALVVLGIILWCIVGGWTVVGDHQVGVLQRFGRLQGVLQPGFHVHAPSPIDQVRKIDLGQVRTLSDETRFLTGDGQLALVDYYVQYKITNARDYLFSSRDAEDAARNAAAIAVRATVGTHTLQELMDRSENALGKDIQAHMQKTLAGEQLGLEITEAGIQEVDVPTEVRKAFEGIDTAREAAKAAQATAEAEVASNKVQAQARAASIKADAAAYRSQAAAVAAADVARFGQVLEQYRAAPQVTKHRLWLETMQEVLAKNHVVVNSGSGNVIVPFPTSNTTATPAPAGSSAPASASSAPVPVTSGPAVHGARQ